MMPEDSGNNNHLRYSLCFMIAFSCPMRKDDREKQIMPNLSSLLKAEIIRISRKEIKASVKPVKDSNADLKKNIAELKKRIAALESQIKKFQSLLPAQEKANVSPEVVEKTSFSSRNIKALRTRLGISQGDLQNFWE